MTGSLQKFVRKTKTKVHETLPEALILTFPSRLWWHARVVKTSFSYSENLQQLPETEHGMLRYVVAKCLKSNKRRGNLPLVKNQLGALSRLIGSALAVSEDTSLLCMCGVNDPRTGPLKRPVRFLSNCGERVGEVVRKYLE